MMMSASENRKTNLVKNDRTDYDEQVAWSAPSNIALIKYWGKRENQIPENSSLSMTLKNAVTTTRVYYRKSSSKTFHWDFYFHGKKKPSFYPKLENFFRQIHPYYPELEGFEFRIESENTFPHSSGIASSASSMSALSLCMLSLVEKTRGAIKSDKGFFREASFLSRLGSGSASRSVFPGFAVWGEHTLIEDASNEYAVPLNFEVHPKFRELRDAILIVNTEKKKVSSTQGHESMVHHPFAKERYNQAQQNMKKLLASLESGEQEGFIQIIENEALTLHAMMMSANPGFILMNPSTLSIIDEVRKFRKESGAFISFTLDAGPNVHLLYSKGNEDVIHEFINNNLIKYCNNGQVIFDGIGDGPVKICSEN